MKTEEKITRMQDIDERINNRPEGTGIDKELLAESIKLGNEITEELYRLGDIERLIEVFDLQTCPKCQGEKGWDAVEGIRNDGLVFDRWYECDLCTDFGTPGYIPRGEYDHKIDDNGDWIE